MIDDADRVGQIRRIEEDGGRHDRLLIIIEGDDAGGFRSYAPDLPGVVAAASTYEECVALMREAVAFHLEGMREDGDPIPEPRAVGAETVPAA